MTKKITWLEFLAIENRMWALLKIAEKHLRCRSISFFSLSDNTLSKYWLNDTDGAFYGNYSDNDLLFKAKFNFLASSKNSKESLFEIELLEDGELRFWVEFDVPEKSQHTKITEMLTKFDTQVCIPLDEHDNFYQALLKIFQSLENPKVEATWGEKEFESIKKYVIWN